MFLKKSQLKYFRENITGRIHDAIHSLRIHVPRLPEAVQVTTIYTGRVLIQGLQTCGIWPLRMNKTKGSQRFTYLNDNIYCYNLYVLK